jgi:hypothetical protein
MRVDKGGEASHTDISKFLPKKFNGVCNNMEKLKNKGMLKINNCDKRRQIDVLSQK